MTTLRPGSPVATPRAVGDVIAIEKRGDAVVGLVSFRADVPVIRTVADAEALFGRGAEVIHARGGVAECLAAAAADPPPLVIAVPPGGWQASDVLTVPASLRLVSNLPPPRDLAAENAALRAALDVSGELLAEAHKELERLRGGA